MSRTRSTTPTQARITSRSMIATYKRAGGLTDEERARRRVLALSLLLGLSVWPVTEQQVAGGDAQQRGQEAAP